MEAATTAAGDRAEPRARTKKAKPPKTGTPWWMWLAGAAIVVFCLFPFYWLINLSLKTGDALAPTPLYPPHPTLRNYKSIFQNGDFTRSLLNSAIISLATTALAIVVGSFCAYA